MAQAGLRHRFPHLQMRPGDLKQDVKQYDCLLNEIRTNIRSKRITQFHSRMRNINNLTRWVKDLPDDKATAHQNPQDIRPEEMLRKGAETWSHLWNPQNGQVAPEAIDPYLERIPQDRHNCPSI